MCSLGLSEGPIDSAGLSQRHGGFASCQPGAFIQRRRDVALCAALEQPEIGSRLRCSLVSEKTPRSYF